jgi:hypothetical protein
MSLNDKSRAFGIDKQSFEENKQLGEALTMANKL